MLTMGAIRHMIFKKQGYKFIVLTRSCLRKGGKTIPYQASNQPGVKQEYSARFRVVEIGDRCVAVFSPNNEVY